MLISILLKHYCMQKVLFVFLYAGLCNRMRVMASAIALSKETNSKVVFFGECSKDLNAPFKSLFEDIPYPVVEFRSTSKVQQMLFMIGEVVKSN